MLSGDADAKENLHLKQTILLDLLILRWEAKKLCRLRGTCYYSKGDKRWKKCQILYQMSRRFGPVPFISRMFAVSSCTRISGIKFKIGAKGLYNHQRVLHLFVLRSNLKHLLPLLICHSHQWDWGTLWGNILVNAFTALPRVHLVFPLQSISVVDIVWVGGISYYQKYTIGIIIKLWLIWQTDDCVTSTTYWVGCNTTDLTLFLWLVSVTLDLPAAKSHRRIVQSWLPVTTCRA